MSETIVPNALMRREELVELHGVPEHMPEALANFAWPENYAKQLDAASKVTDALYDAHVAWVEAHEEWEDVAPAAD